MKSWNSSIFLQDDTQCSIFGEVELKDLIYSPSLTVLICTLLEPCCVSRTELDLAIKREWRLNLPVEHCQHLSSPMRELVRANLDYKEDITKC